MGRYEYDKTSYTRLDGAVKVRDTEKAILLSFANGEKQVWIPKAAVKIEEGTDNDGDYGAVYYVADWWRKKQTKILN